MSTETENIFQDKNEQEHFQKVVNSFKSYHFCLCKSVANSLSTFRALDERHKDYLFDYEDNCKQLLECIDHNNFVISLFLRDVESMFSNSPLDEFTATENGYHSTQDVDRVCTTLKQISRDWSSAGEQERSLCYKPILNELEKLYADKNHEEINVLVPGSGLGRLAFDIASKGFKCEGNEFSMHMLVVANFIINKCFMKNQYKVYPYVDSWSNNLKFENQLRAIEFPDVSPQELVNQLSNFSMVAGDFLEVYNDEASFDCIVTCFFIDTAHNVIDYVEKIWSLLKEGGYWINLGPLLYHYSKMAGELSIELSYDQLKRVIQRVGFNLMREELGLETKYNSDDKSLLKYVYESIFFVVQRPSLVCSN